MIGKLAASERVEHVFVRHAFRFWMGRNETLHDAPVLKAAHSRWGGGRELGHVTLLALLDLICQLQASAEEIAETLLAQAPQEVQQVMIPSRTRAKILSS